MRLAKHQKRRALDINMTPMIDVVFQLLIFFMTCSQVSEANREALELPRLKGTEDQARSEIIANIDDQGHLSVTAERCTVPEFVALCAEEATREHEGNPGQLMISVRADRRGNCKTVNELVTALTKLGVTKVRLAVQSGP
jgi:biopolymer transport protein ExbD